MERFIDLVRVQRLNVIDLKNGSSHERDPYFVLLQTREDQIVTQPNAHVSEYII